MPLAIVHGLEHLWEAEVPEKQATQGKKKTDALQEL
jgi:hypothetical protein